MDMVAHDAQRQLPWQHRDPEKNRKLSLHPKSRLLISSSFSNAKSNSTQQNAQIRGQALQDHRDRQGCSQPRFPAAPVGE
jgi:hypothetical protein